MEHDLSNTVALLTRAPAVLDALLRHLPDAWSNKHEGGTTWSAFGVVVHNPRRRVDWMPRLKLILGSWEAREFQPFERMGHVREVQGRSLGDLLDEFACPF